LGLLVFYVVGIFLLPISWIGWLFGAILLVVGLTGSARRHTGMLKFYWVITAIGLVMAIIAILLLLVGAVVLYADMKMHPEQYLLTGNDTKSNFAKQANTLVQFVCEHLTQVIISAVEAVVILFITTFLKVRSICLAQQLCKQIELLPHYEDVEAVEQQTDSEPETLQNAQPICVISQPMFAAPQQQFNFANNYPGSQLVPIYVDSFGNPIIL